MNYIDGAEKLILNAAIDIATTKGISAVSIREVALMCNLSVGTVYNNYKNKDELIAAVIGDFWRSAFLEINIKAIFEKSAVDAIEIFYYEFEKHFASFKTNILTQLLELENARKQSIRLKEADAIKTLVSTIQKVLEGHFPPKYYSSLELEKMAIAILDIVLAMLKRNEKDFSFAKHLIAKIIQYN